MNLVSGASRLSKKSNEPTRGAYMETRRFLSWVIIVTLIAAMTDGCTSVRLTPPQGNYYVTSEIAYLRDGPSYEGRVLGQLYRGDQVEGREPNVSDWWRVRSARTGQEGWIQQGLLSLDPVSITYYYVKRDVHLKECPGEVCPALQLLYRGDEVQQVQKNDQGWWRVLVIKGRGLGWLPSDVLAEQPILEQAATSAQSYYYVAVSRLKLHQQPLSLAEVVKTLEFNDQLVKLAESPLGWFKVRQPASGAVGWVEARYLEAQPQRSPRRFKRLKKPLPKAPAVEPEVM
jgi:uncharacterized protein YgiM (DUF1202 family)